MNVRRTRPGDFLRICDISGFAVPASRTRKQWDNLIVDRKYFDEKHPQLTIRSKRDDFSIKDARPRPVDAFVGPLTTTVVTAASPGSATIEVDSSARFADNDIITITTNTNDVYRAIVGAIPDASHITLTAVLHDTIPVGAMIVNYTAVSQPDYGQ